MAPPGLWRCAHHSNYETLSSTQYDRTTKRCKHSFPAPTATIWRLRPTLLIFFQTNVRLLKKRHYCNHSPPHERCAFRHFRSTTRRGVCMRRCILVLEWSANALLQCSDPNGAQHEQPPALRPILQPRHTAIFLQ